MHAAAFKLYSDGRVRDSQQVRNLASPEQNSRLSSSLFSSDKALAILLDCQLTKHAYQYLRTEAKEMGSDIYPPYNHVVAAKNRCLPLTSSLEMSDFSASCQLPPLLDHTSSRIVELQRDVLDSKPLVTRLTLRYKAGFDGSTGQSVYKQVTSTGNPRNIQEEASLFFPLQLTGYDGTTKYIFWRNPAPSSTHYCRPLRFCFVKETKEVLLAEEEFDPFVPDQRFE